jgi:hypothetical protein
MRAFIDRLGMGDRLVRREAPMAVMHRGRVFPPMPGLPTDTGLPGLLHASLALVYDRGVSKALAPGARVAQAAVASRNW